jgi:hypothetical protein
LIRQQPNFECGAFNRSATSPQPLNRRGAADEAIQAALDWLEDEDWLRGEPSGGTGPGSGRRTRYRIHAAIKGKRKGGDA